MNDDARKQLSELERALGAFEQASKEALGFSWTVRFNGVAFDIGRRFVLADMTPLAFFHLVETITDDGPEAAIARLYDRLVPLLTCRHRWTLLRRSADEPLLSMAKGLVNLGSDPYICKACTAYFFGSPGVTLPVIGRDTL